MECCNLWECPTPIKNEELNWALDSLLRCIFNSVSNGEVIRLRREINELLEQEALLWKQRSRVCWLKEGDHITAFPSKSFSMALEDSNSLWREDKTQISGIVLDYFTDLFSS